MLNDLHVLESLPAYALGSLDEEEARSIAEHLAGCYLCRQELNAFQAVADQLPLAVPDESPSDELRPRLMERVQGLNVKRPVESGRQHLPKRLLPIGALAGLALILLFAFSNLLLWQKLNDLEVLTGPLGMRAIALQNTEAAPSSSGFVIMGADGLNGVLVVDKLPQLDATREYQVWLVRDATYTGGPVFSVDETGYRGIRLEAPENLLTYSSVLVTVEPAGGSPDPTGEHVLNGSLHNPEPR
jgi:anti-sigma-K factor RskA